MTTAANNIAKPATAFAFTGKGRQARLNASLQIAPLAFAEDTSRTASLTNMRLVLGLRPSEALVKAAKVQWIIGRVASRLPVNELPRGKTTPADRLAHATSVVTLMARAPAEGVTPAKLRKGQIGRRTAMQQRVTRAAEEACSLFFAELGLTNARTQKEKAQRAAGKSSRAPSMAGSGKGKAAKPVPPSHSELVQKPAPLTVSEAVTYLVQQSSAMQAFANKHAALLPTDAGLAVAAFRKAMLAAANAHETRKAIAAAAKADKPAKASPAKLVAVA